MATADTDQLEALSGATPVPIEHPDLDNFEHGFPPGFGPGGWGLVACGLALAFAAFQIAISVSTPSSARSSASSISR